MAAPAWSQARRAPGGRRAVHRPGTLPGSRRPASPAPTAPARPGRDGRAIDQGAAPAGSRRQSRAQPHSSADAGCTGSPSITAVAPSVTHHTRGGCSPSLAAASRCASTTARQARASASSGTDGPTGSVRRGCHRRPGRRPAGARPRAPRRPHTAHGGPPSISRAASISASRPPSPPRITHAPPTGRAASTGSVPCHSSCRGLPSTPAASAA